MLFTFMITSCVQVSISDMLFKKNIYFQKSYAFVFLPVHGLSVVSGPSNKSIY